MTKVETSAVPDVRELKRFEFRQAEFLGGDNTLETAEGEDADNGEYVLYSQAAEIITTLETQALKDRKRADEAQSNSNLWQYSCDVKDQPPLIVKLWERVKATEAKLAQYEAQKPFSYLEASLLIDQAFKTWAEKPHNRKWVKRIDGTPIPNDLCSVISERVAGLYASPAPAADLKAENERLRAAAKRYLDASKEHFHESDYVADGELMEADAELLVLVTMEDAHVR